MQEQAQTLTLLRPPDPGREPLRPADYVERLGFWSRPDEPRPRPHVAINLVSSADGRATIHGHSAPLSSQADRELFHALRAPADAVLVGAGTVRAERYGRLIRDPSVRALRRSRGLSEEPLACVVSASLDLDPGIPLLDDPATRLVVITPSQREMPATGMPVSYVRPLADGRLDLAAALRELTQSFGVQLLLCEGGPHLARELVGAGLIDELFLSLSPLLAAGDLPGEPAMGILAGAGLDPPVELELRDALEADGHLFLRYGVEAPDRVWRATTPSSSLES